MQFYLKEEASLQLQLKEVENGYTAVYDNKTFVLEETSGTLVIRDNKHGLKYTIEIIEVQEDVEVEA